MSPDEPAGAGADLEAWLALAHAPGVGPRQFGELLACFGTPRAVLEASRAALARAGVGDEVIEGLARPDWAAAEAALAWAREPANHLLTLADPRFPPLLREIPDPPPVLYVRGAPDHLAEPQLAVVGSRNPTPGGLETAREFAAHLAQTGLGVTSGLALGIDAAAHAAALEAGGSTVAVVATGLDRVYPARHRDLAHRIAEAGALVSEFPLGAPPRRGHFPRRNRLISGLALGTLVVEAGVQSGSLITARHGLEQGREVFAIPGSIHNPLARGCHALIRQGAKLVETAADILEELGGIARGALDTLDAPEASAASGTSEPATDLSSDYAQLIDLMGYEPVSIDTLVQRSGLTANAVSSMLLLLELQGMVASASGGRYVRVRQED